MFSVGYGMSLVPVGLSGLSQEDEGRRVSRLQAEGKVEKYERVDVEYENSDAVQENPDGDNDRLADEEYWRSKEACERLGFERKPIGAESR